MSRENVELAHCFYDAFNRRDFDALLAFMDPEVEFAARFIEMEGDPYYRGHDGVREWWRARSPGRTTSGARPKPSKPPGCGSSRLLLWTAMKKGLLR
jgi:ketosteroid isomerase-like protein